MLSKILSSHPVAYRATAMRLCPLVQITQKRVMSCQAVVVHTLSHHSRGRGGQIKASLVYRVPRQTKLHRETLSLKSTNFLSSFHQFSKYAFPNTLGFLTLSGKLPSPPTHGYLSTLWLTSEPAWFPFVFSTPLIWT